MDEFFHTVQGDPERTQFLLPVLPVGADDRFHVILINRGILVTDCPDIFVFFQFETDLLVVRKWDLGVGNDQSQKEGMSAPEFRASDPAEPKSDSSGRKFYIPFVITMNGKTGTMAAGAG